MSSGISGNKELWEKGLQTRREVVGESYVDGALKNGASEFAFAGQQLVTEYVNKIPHDPAHGHKFRVDIKLDLPGAQYGLAQVSIANSEAC